jgi:hypothetical protein
MAFIQMTSANENSVHAVCESPQDKRQVDPAAAHRADQSDVGCVLLSGDSSEIGSAVRSPVADKAQQPGLELDACAHIRSSPFVKETPRRAATRRLSQNLKMDRAFSPL